MYQYTEELKVYGITTSDYNISSNAITGTGVGGAVTDGDVANYFEDNKYDLLEKPTEDYTVPGHGKLTAQNLSSVLVEKVYETTEAMKTAVLSDDYISKINTHSTKVEYYLVDNTKLQIRMFFDTEAKRNSFLDSVKARPSGQFKEAGTVITTL